MVWLSSIIYMTLAINVMDGYDFSNKAHHKCLPKQIGDTILVIEFIEGSCYQQQSEVEHFSYKVSEHMSSEGL